MSAVAMRVLFHLAEPINLVDFSQFCTNGNQHRLDPGDYELEEVDNPYSGTPDGVSWLALVKDGKASTIGTSLPNWETHGSFPEGL